MAYSKNQIESIFKEICKQISEEGLSLRKVLNHSDMPDMVTFNKWLDNDENKINQYVRACKKRADVIFEEIVVIADDQESDVYENQDGVEVTNHNVINRSRLRVDARKWVVSKMNPKKYGDKLDFTSGGDKINQIDYSKLSASALKEIADLDESKSDKS